MFGGLPRSTLLDGLISYWKLDENSQGYEAVNRNDSVGANHLTDTTAGSVCVSSAVGVIGEGAIFDATKTHYLTKASNTSLQTGDIDWTVAFRVKLPAVNVFYDLINKHNNYGSGNAEYTILYYGSSDKRFHLFVSPNGSTPFADVSATNFGEPVAGQWYSIRVWHDSVANKIYIQVNDTTPNSLDHATGVFASNSPFIIGALPAASRYASCTIDEVGFWKRTLTDAEWLQYRTSGKSYPFLSVGAVVNNLMAFDGNSLSDEVFATYPATWPRNTFDALVGGTYMYKNFAASGQTITQMTTDAAVQIDTLISQVSGKKILICWEGINELQSGTNAADTYSKIVTYCQARQAAGWEVVVFTLLPATGSAILPSYEADRQTVNTNIRANWATFADALCDVGNDSRIGEAGDSNNATYYQDDKIHLRPGGNAVVQELATVSIGSLL
jgi:lysophospholipase L1-like esterase